MSVTNPVVRRATLADWPGVKAARLWALADAPEAFGSTLAQEAAFDDAEWQRRVRSGNWFLALDGDHIVGMAASLEDEQKPTERHLSAMWVAPEFRGGTAASDLVNSICEAAKCDGFSAVTLWVADPNTRAWRFYERLGFRTTGIRKPQTSNPAVGAELLRLDLSLETSTD